MSIISIPYIFSVGAVIIASQHNSNFSTIANDYNGNITNDNISNSAAISDSKLGTISTAGKVSGAAFFSLASIPPGAGVMPAANVIAPVSATVFTDRGDPAAADFTSFTTDGAYHDLDLSSIIPAGTKAVLVSFKALPDSTGKTMILKKKGVTNNINIYRLDAFSASIASYIHGIVAVGSDRTIQYYFDSATWTSTSLIIRGWWI